MPQGHHRHESQAQKRHSAMVRQRAEEKRVAVEDRPVAVIDIGEKRISELIRSITGPCGYCFKSWLDLTKQAKPRVMLSTPKPSISGRGRFRITPPRPRVPR